MDSEMSVNEMNDTSVNETSLNDTSINETSLNDTSSVYNLRGRRKIPSPTNHIKTPPLKKSKRYNAINTIPKNDNNIPNNNDMEEDEEYETDEPIFTKDGYVQDGFIEEDDLFNFRTVKCWKDDLSPAEIKNIEPELIKIRNIIREETPTIPKIIQANITQEDKKRCIKLFDQAQDLDAVEQDKIYESINNIIKKGAQHTPEEIRELEIIESRSKNMSTAPDNLKNQILLLDADDKVKSVIYGQYLSMLEHELGSQMYNSIREEIEWSVRLPHNKCQDYEDISSYNNNQLNKYYSRILQKLDQELYGMQHIKMKMLHIINDRRLSNNMCRRNIAITGPPGTGKSVIGEALAKVLNVPFEKISVGGMEDASIFKGSDKVWNSASPSIILQILSRMKSSSGIIMFDELDKLGETSKGKEVQSALIHIADYAHNHEFRDNYLNKYTHNLSKILFIFNMNRTDNLDSALLNRLDVIETYPYTVEEKIHIIQNYVLPKALQAVGLNKNDITLDIAVTKKLINSCIEDPGVRSLERIIKEIVGRINLYNAIILSDGTTGNIKLTYTIPNFKLPLKINMKLLDTIIN